MIKVDLITGFLGSGKTTFIKKYVHYLVSQGLKIGIIENDYGAVNVDMLLLNDMEDDVDLEMVSAACDTDCHRRRLKTKLIKMGMLGYDRVLIEPSGIFDVDEFFDILYEDPLINWYEIGNVIAIVDARLDDDLSRESDYLLASEIANAGIVILSKTQELSEHTMEHTLAHVNKALGDIKCQRVITDVLKKDWDDLNDQDYQMIMNSGYVSEDYLKLNFDQEDAYSSQYFLNIKADLDMITKRIEILLDDETCGHIFRIKGFLEENNQWLELNFTKKEKRINPIKQGQDVIIVIGEHLNKEKIEDILKGR